MPRRHPRIRNVTVYFGDVTQRQDRQFDPERGRNVLNGAQLAHAADVTGRAQDRHAFDLRTDLLE